MKLEIANGRVIDPAQGIDAVQSVFVCDGRIAGIGSAPSGFAAARTIDARGLVVCPGLVDLSAKIDEGGKELRAAVAGGVTSVCCPPDMDPPLDEPALVETLVRRAGSLGLARIYPLGALTVGLRGEALAGMVELAAAGCVAFSQARQAIVNTQILFRAMQYAATFDLALWLQAQDPYLTAGGVAHDGEVAARLGLPGVPVCAETVALQTLLTLARETGARLHVGRLSSGAAVNLVRSARAAGISVSCDVAVHHLHLTEADIGFFDPMAHLDPPLRTAADRDALRAGLVDGTIGAICSDHTPLDADGKQVPFAEAKSGATGLELLLPLTLAWAEQAGVDLSFALRRITCDAAAIAGIDAGSLKVGAAADICLFDPGCRWTVSGDSLVSRGHNTPLLGRTLSGRVRYTLVAGEISFGD